jgi:hypothetical protein
MRPGREEGREERRGGALGALEDGGATLGGRVEPASKGGGGVVLRAVTGGAPVG